MGSTSLSGLDEDEKAIVDDLKNKQIGDTKTNIGIQIAESETKCDEIEDVTISIGDASKELVVEMRNKNKANNIANNGNQKVKKENIFGAKPKKKKKNIFK